jgi:hypothetical protein
MSSSRILENWNVLCTPNVPTCTRTMSVHTDSRDVAASAVVQALQQVVKGCLRVNPADRLTMEEVEQQLLAAGTELELQRQAQMQTSQP